MQTFLPQTSSFKHIAKELDNKRLNKQTLEGWQILLAITKLDPQGNYRDPKGWANHPATKMWRGHETALVSYLSATYFEWISRGFKSTMLVKIYKTYDIAVMSGSISQSLTLPSWMQDTKKYEELAATHRVALLYKNYEWYSKFNWKEDTGEKPKYYQYLWPDTQGDMYLGTYNAA